MISLVAIGVQVCLSLLGTFHGDGQSAKWNPQYSSLFQLVMSVQTQIFTPDPYFNEPVRSCTGLSAELARCVMACNGQVNTNLHLPSSVLLAADDGRLCCLYIAAACCSLSAHCWINVGDFFLLQNTEQLRGTKEGAASDHSYNAGVVLATVRYAMVDALRNPRPGFELVVRTHFALLRHRVLDQCKRWRADFAGEGEAYQSSLVRAIGDLYSLLVQLA